MRATNLLPFFLCLLNYLLLDYETSEVWKGLEPLFYHISNRHSHYRPPYLFIIYSTIWYLSKPIVFSSSIPPCLSITC